MAKSCPVCGTGYADDISFCPKDGSTLLADGSSGDLVGRIIADRYKVSELLGEGGMGRVYLARHVRLPQQAAIKVMHASMARDGDAVARFNREAANAARIEHDRVARVFDFGETSDGVVYLAMEYVPGRTLRSLLERESHFTPARAASITYQVAEGLDAAHRLGIVHRDLKPDNILVVTDEQGVDRCKVVDFGIAKAGDGSGTQLTRTGMIVGTPEFMSPEQVVGEAVDARSDVYALALVAFQMFTGELPFKGNTPERALMTRLMEDPRTLVAVTPDVAWPEALQEAFTRALDREVNSRTPSALAFADAVLAATESWLGTPVLRGRTPASLPAVAAGVTPRGGTPIVGASPSAAQPAAAPPDTSAGAATRTAASATSNAATGAPVHDPSRSAGSLPPAATAGRGRAPLVIGAVLAVALVGGWMAFASNGRTVPAGAADSSAARSGVTNAPATGGGGTDGARVLPNATRRSDTREVAPSQGTVGNTPAPQPPPTAPAGAASTTPLPAGAAPAPTAGGNAVAAGVLAARKSLDSLRNVLEDANSGAAEARAAIPALQRLLRDLGGPADSAWAYLALVSAYGQSGDPQRACNPLRSARRLAATEAQRQAVATFFSSDALACVP